MVKTRKRRKQVISFDDRLQQAANTARDIAEQLPCGAERDLMLGRARQAEIARQINGWLLMPVDDFPK